MSDFNRVHAYIQDMDAGISALNRCMQEFDEKFIGLHNGMVCLLDKWGDMPHGQAFADELSDLMMEYNIAGKESTIIENENDHSN